MYRFNLIWTFHVTLKNFLPGYWEKIGARFPEYSQERGGGYRAYIIPRKEVPALGEMAHLLYSTSFPADDSLPTPGFAAAVKCGGVATPLPLFL